jgi:hypothetical protein
MIKTRFFLGVVGLVLLSGCGSQIIDGGGLDTNGSGAVPVAGGKGVDRAPVLPAVAMTRAQLDVLWDEYWETHGGGVDSSGSGGGPALDPDDLFLRVSDLGASCSSPTVDLSCGGHWEVSIALPSAYQQVGVYDLEGPGILSYSLMVETGPASAQEPGVCPAGGGSLGPGAIEVLALDASNVTFRLTVTGLLGDNDPSGVYTAPRCP